MDDPCYIDRSGGVRSIGVEGYNRLSTSIIENSSFTIEKLLILGLVTIIAITVIYYLNII